MYVTKQIDKENSNLSYMCCACYAAWVKRGKEGKKHQGGPCLPSTTLFIASLLLHVCKQCKEIGALDMLANSK